MAITQKPTITYPLTFLEAVEKVMNGEGWAQGDNFADGMIIMEEGGMFMQGRDYLHVHNFKAKGSERKFNLNINQGIMRQKYRMVSTQPDAERKV